jgi:nucleoside-diphosphate-sugar epimerase
MRVFVAGATGAIGRPLVAQLAAAGHEVVALTRSRDAADRLRASGVEPVVADALDRDDVVEAIRAAYPQAVVHQLTAIPRVLRPRKFAEDFALTNRLRTEGTRNLLAGATAAGAERFVAQGIAFAYPPGGDSPKTEADPLWREAPGGFRAGVEALAEMEAAALGANGTVLRYGLFYGPGTAYAADGAVADDVRRRRMPIVGDGNGCFPFIHVDDAAAAAVAALASDARGAFNVVDDEPARLGEWLPRYAELLGAPPPRRVPKLLARLAAGAVGVHYMTALPLVSNARARQELGWAPCYPTWREGFGAELGTAKDS